MRIDAHMHVNYDNYSAKDLIDYLNKNRFDCCWLMTWEEFNPKGWPYQHLSIEDVYETYLLYPSRIVPMYAPDPHNEDASENLKYWYNKGIKGCAELKSAINWQSKKANTLLSTVSELKIPLLFHMQESSELFSPIDINNKLDVFLCRIMETYRLKYIPKKIMKKLENYSSQLSEWDKKRYIPFPGYMLNFATLGITLRDFSNINFIGHGPLFWKHISADVRDGGTMYPTGLIKKGGILCDFLREYDNLYADISGAGVAALNRDHNFSKKFIQEFRDKLIFGSDNISTEIESLLKSFNLSSQIINQIFGKNATNLIN